MDLTRTSTGKAPNQTLADLIVPTHAGCSHGARVQVGTGRRPGAPVRTLPGASIRVTAPTDLITTDPERSHGSAASAAKPRIVAGHLTLPRERGFKSLATEAPDAL